MGIWRQLKVRGGPDDVPHIWIGQLRIHRGQQGIFRDLEITSHLAESTSGVAVGILHTGTSYEDDVAEDGIIYRYPHTGRGERDSNEIAALKACYKLNLPLFVVITPRTKSSDRNIRLGWIQEYDDESKQALIEFLDSDSPPSRADAQNFEQQPFTLYEERPGRYSRTKVRPNQWRFRFDVFKRYGSSCVVCGIRRLELLQAAHLCPIEAGGSDDPRNGLVFCLTHHCAFDTGLLRIHPKTFELHVGNGVRSLEELGISRVSIANLPRPPHLDALNWAWRRLDESKNSRG